MFVLLGSGGGKKTIFSLKNKDNIEQGKHKSQECGSWGAGKSRVVGSSPSAGRTWTGTLEQGTNPPSAPIGPCDDPVRGWTLPSSIVASP